jgi:hypothetical protein
MGGAKWRKPWPETVGLSLVQSVSPLSRRATDLINEFLFWGGEGHRWWDSVGGITDSQRLKNRWEQIKIYIF